MLREQPGLESVTPTKKAHGCGLMGLQSTLPIGIQARQTVEKPKTVLTPTVSHNGMTIRVLPIFPLFVHFLQPVLATETVTYV